ncbi:MAG: hypothetical protein WCK35_11690 [Chloroflexota bacterium]
MGQSASPGLCTNNGRLPGGKLNSTGTNQLVAVKPFVGSRLTIKNNPGMFMDMLNRDRERFVEDFADSDIGFII